MTQAELTLPRRSFGQTMRADVWWAQPLIVFLGLGAFVVYSTWAAFQGKNYYFGPYLSPFYSPEIFGASPHSWFGPKPLWWPAWLLFSPALLVLWAPGGFRLTCYYYRGAYYKAFWADPPACTVGEPRSTYLGERSFPLIMQNVHRYFLYLALLFHSRALARCLESDVVHRPGDRKDFVRDRRRHAGAGGERCSARRLHFGLSLFATSRRWISRSVLEITHLLSGLCLRRLLQPPAHALGLDEFVLGAFSDIYVRLCAVGVWHDLRFF